MKDIEGRDIEPGDLVIVPKYSSLSKSYFLYYTKAGNPVVSCYKEDGCILRGNYHHPEEHNSKQQIGYGYSEMYIIEKNCKIPDTLKKYIRNVGN